MGDVVLIARHRGARQQVVALGDDLVEPWMEVSAVAAESVAFAAEVLDLARALLRALATDRVGVAAMHARSLEDLAPRRTGRAKRAGVLAAQRQAELGGGACMDGIVAPAHGRAA